MQHIWPPLMLGGPACSQGVNAPFPARSRAGQQGLAISVDTQLWTASEAGAEGWPLRVRQVLCS